MFAASGSGVLASLRTCATTKLAFSAAYLHVLPCHAFVVAVAVTLALIDLLLMSSALLALLRGTPQQDVYALLRAQLVDCVCLTGF